MFQNFERKRNRYVATSNSSSRIDYVAVKCILETTLRFNIFFLSIVIACITRTYVTMIRKRQTSPRKYYECKHTHTYTRIHTAWLHIVCLFVAYWTDTRYTRFKDLNVLRNGSRYFSPSLPRTSVAHTYVRIHARIRSQATHFPGAADRIPSNVLLTYRVCSRVNVEKPFWRLRGNHSTSKFSSNDLHRSPFDRSCAGQCRCAIRVSSNG